MIISSCTSSTTTSRFFILDPCRRIFCFGLAFRMSDRNEVFIANFNLNGAEEDFSFLEMMDEISNLKSPFFGISKKEHSGGSIIAQIISGKIYYEPIGHQPLKN